MGQVFDVHFLNGDTQEELYKGFILATKEPYNETDHTPRHKEVIELGIKTWGNGTVTLENIERFRGPLQTGEGANAQWGYAYYCTIRMNDDPQAREMVANLYEQYKEQAAGGGTAGA